MDRRTDGPNNRPTDGWTARLLELLRAAKNHTTSWDNKKITQPFGTKKSCNPLGQKKRNLSRQKKIMQPLDKKNHATSRDKQQSRNLAGQTKITQPLRTNKTPQPLGTKKSRNLLGQKITPLGTKKLHNLSRQQNHSLNRSNCV